MRKFLERHFEALDLFWAVITGSGLLAWELYFGATHVVGESLDGVRSTLYQTISGLFGTLFGFGGAALALVLSFADSPRLNKVRTSRHWPALWAVFTRAVAAFAAAAIWPLIAMVLDTEKHPSPASVSFTLGLTAYAVLKLRRLLWIFRTVVQLVTIRESESTMTPYRGARDRVS